MQVKCVSDINCPKLTKGKTYTASECTEHYYVVKNDGGIYHSYLPEVFEAVPEKLRIKAPEVKQFTELEKAYLEIDKLESEVRRLKKEIYDNTPWYCNGQPGG